MLNNMSSTVTDMCSHGLVDPEWGVPVRKSTRLVATSAFVTETLGARCTKDHHHRAISGNWSYDGRKVTASSWAGGHTTTFAMRVLRAFEAELLRNTLHCYEAFGLENDLEASRLRAWLDENRSKNEKHDV